jgi:phage terminase Nu1 subunit (DNA packaging protein)
MELIKQAAYAKLHDVSRKTVTMWKARGWLVMRDGLVDVEASNALLKKYRRDGAPAVTAAPEQETDSGNEREPRKSNALDEARITKEHYLGKLNQLEYEKKAGAVVQFETARAVFFDVFREQRDAWLNWPMRVGPLIAAALGLEADKVTEVLTEHVHKHVSQLAEPEANFGERQG